MNISGIDKDDLSIFRELWKLNQDIIVSHMILGRTCMATKIKV